jgi:hypothetical protein
VYAALAVLIPMAVSAPLVLGVVTFTGDGWVPYPLASSAIGTPYKDFFFPAPPGELWLGRLATLTSDPLLAIHLVGVIWVGIFSLSVFMIARKFTSNGIALVGAMIGSATWISQLFDRSGGWNQQYIAMLWLGAAFLVEATDQLNKRRPAQVEQAHPNLPAILLATLAGLCFAISALIKQTAIPSFAIVILGSLLWTLFLGYRRLRDWLKWTGGGLALGLGVPAAATLIWLASIGAVSGFFVAMTKNGGKNSPASVQIQYVLSEFGQVLADPKALFVTSAFVVLCVLGLGRVSTRAILRPIVVIVGSAFAYLAVVSYAGSTNALALPFALLIAVYLSIEMSDGVDVRIRVLAAMVVVLASVGYAVRYNGGSGALTALTQFQGAAADQITLIGLGLALVAGALYEAIRVTSSKYSRADRLLAAMEDSSNAGIDPPLSKDSEWPGTSSAAAIGFAATWGIAVIRPLSGPWILGLFVSGGVALGVAWIIHIVRLADLRLPNSISVMLVGWALLISVGFLASSYEVPYAWWGWQEPTFTLHRIYSNSEYLRGFQLNPESADFYNKLNDIFLNLRKRLPSNPTIVTYPNIAIAVNLSGFTPIRMECPVLWWDLCPDDYAIESLNQMKAEKPDVLVWEFPSSYAIVTNEDAYRGGKKSALRKWGAWENEVVKNGTYTLIGTVTEPGSQPLTGWLVGVYARTDALTP